MAQCCCMQFIVVFGLGLVATTTTSIAVPIPTIEQLSTSRYVPTHWLLGLRTAFATIIAFCLRSSLTDPEPHVFTMITYAGSRLPPKSVEFAGVERLSTFTVQCWTLQLVYFALAAAFSAMYLTGGQAGAMGAVLGQVTHVLYEVCVATSLLVTSVVTLVLLPARLKRGDYAGARRMLGWRPQLMHNANLLFATSELLLNGMPILAPHFVFAGLFGIQYVFMTWWWLKRTGIVYYAFLDPTLPPKKSIALHTVLILALACFFALGAGLDRLALLVPFAVRAPLLAAAACSLMWTSFIRGLPKAAQVGKGEARGGTE
jgi:hypothetical protein